MSQEKQFRCPYEELGDREQRLIDVKVVGHKLSRLDSIRGALKAFQNNPNLLGVRLTLPMDILAGKNFESLKVALIPFQAELAAIEIEQRLGTDLVYYPEQINGHILNSLFKEDPSRALTAIAFHQMVRELKVPHPRSAAELSILIQTIFQRMYSKGLKNPKILLLSDTARGKKFVAGHISLGGFTSELDRGSKETDKNLFSIVRCPLYPKSFGRYNDNLQIVLSREADFTTLPTDVRRKIRSSSNSILARHGIKILDQAEDKQPDGLWIPD
jgi:hypothetical protein